MMIKKDQENTLMTTSTWKKLLVDNPSIGKIDMITSIKEDTINDYLAAHRKHDNKYYAFNTKFNLASQFPNRNSPQLQISGNLGTKNDPVKIDFSTDSPPDETMTALLEKDDEQYFDGLSPQNYISVIIKKVGINVKYPKSDGRGDWTLNLPSIDMNLKARITLTEREDVVNGKVVSRYAISIVPTHMVFTKASINGALSTLQKEFYDKVENADAKVGDLMLILLNYIGKDLAPKLVQNIEIPVVQIEELDIYPALLSMLDNKFTIGFNLNTKEIQQKKRKELAQRMSLLKAAIDKDEALHALRSPEGEITFQNRDNLLSEMEAQAAATYDALPIEEEAFSVASGISYAISEHFINKVSAAFIPEDIYEQEPEKEWIKRIAKGQYGYSVVFDSPEIKISGTQLSGGLNIIAEANARYCLKKITDCSWRWVCNKFGLHVTGSPKIKISIKNDRNRGVFLEAKADLDSMSMSAVGVDNWLEGVVTGMVGGLLDTLKSAVKVVVFSLDSKAIYKTELSVGRYNTKLKLSGFTASPWTRLNDSSSPKGKTEYMVFECNTNAVS